MNYDFMNMDENSILGMSFPDYYQSMFMFEDEAAGGSGQGGGIGGGFTFGGDASMSDGANGGGGGNGGAAGLWTDFGYSI